MIAAPFSYLLCETDSGFACHVPDVHHVITGLVATQPSRWSDDQRFMGSSERAQ
ncbi:hypothetical protein MicloDRAFT_00019540 [Microvirga lotononidis]|uniref:Uncharacterized protein n=1 Tax=Microvirga lotononidis TaxID=864069 RepID=I4YZT4_9HYPH|nr:hypothetical protein MicloDRAFT_00019540 [Microvirga lotononidis]